jgi:hypothetical protein
MCVENEQKIIDYYSKQRKACMKLSIVIFIIVGLSSCADGVIYESNPKVYESERNISKLKCEGMPSPQRNECLQDIPPEYNKYQEEREKLLKERARTD